MMEKIGFEGNGFQFCSYWSSEQLSFLHLSAPSAFGIFLSIEWEGEWMSALVQEQCWRLSVSALNGTSLVRTYS